MDIFNTDLNDISLDDKFDEDDPNSITLIRLLAWHIKFRTLKKVKKQKIVK